MGIFFLTRGESAIVYTQLLTYFKTRSQLVCYGMTIASWYLVVIGNSVERVQAGETATQDEQSVATTELTHTSPILYPVHTSLEKSEIGANPPQSPFLRGTKNRTLSPLKKGVGGFLPRNEVQETCVDTIANSGVDDKECASSRDRPPTQIAQFITPLAIPTLLVPISFPTLLPLSSSNIPINSILTPLILAPNNTPAVPSTNAPTAPSRDPRFIIAPQVLDPNAVDPFSTQFILNGNRVSHLTTTVVVAGFETGNFRNTDLSFDVYKLIGAKNVQSVTADRVVRVNSQVESTGIRSVIQNQNIAVSVAQPQTLLGFRQQISLDGNCLDGSGRICTYLPGIKIDDSVLDPQKLQPRSVNITSQFGDVVSPASLAAIREPGFQGGANGENFGIDLNLPAVGIVAPPAGSPPPVLNGERQETFKSEVAVHYARMNQNFATNGTESTLGRTIRSLNYVNGDRNQLANALTNAIGQILPEFQPSIAPGKTGTRIVVNPNLFRAANALRLPDNSLTVYQSGTGSAPSAGKDPRVPPGANHQALWVGMSPVVEREFTRDYRYITLREPRVVASGGGEGGNVPIEVNLNNFGFNSGGLQNAYGQGYVTVFNRDVSRVDTETIRQRTDYYPHISFTGANLSENSLWRYYTGAIVNAGFEPKTTSNLKAYLGTDYAIVNPVGLSFNVGGIGYLNPDPEYYTQLFASATQSIPLGGDPRNNLVLGFNANYIIDGIITIQSLPIRSAQSFINAGIALNLGDVSIGGTQFFGNILSESVDNKTVFNIGWKVTDRLKLGGFFSAFDRNVSTNPFGANLSYDLDPNSDSAIYLGWNAAEIDFRRTLGSTANVYKDNTISVSIRYGF